MKTKDGITLADDDKFTVKTLTLMRVPPLAVGLLLGLILSFATSRFEEVLAKNIQAVFFIPFIVYMADAVGTQTQAIYTRDLARGQAKFLNYVIKESLLGLVLGLIFGLASFAVVMLWINSLILSLAVGISMLVAVGVSPIVALIVTELLELEHQDPAVGAGPIATVIQDTISIVVYGLITSAILLK